MGRLWVKRGVSGTPSSIQLDNEDLIDDLKDAVFRKYPVALARVYDAPDVTICVALPSPNKPNVYETLALAVDESIANVVKMYFPKGQRVEEALVIQIPAGHPAGTTRLPPPSEGSGRAGIRHGSPLSGTLGLLTHDMRDFEYFPETPPLTNTSGLPSQAGQVANQQQQYNMGGYTSHQSTRTTSHAGSLQRSPGGNIIDGSLRPAPPLTMNSAMRTAYRRSPRPSNAQSQPVSQNSVSFYPKQSRHPSQTDLAAPIATAAEGAMQQQPPPPPPPPPLLLGQGDERSVSPSILPLSTEELSAASQIRPPNMLDEANSSTSNESSGNSAQGVRWRRDTLNGQEGTARPARPALGRKHTASKMNLVSPAASAHSSSHSVVKLDTAVKIKKETSSMPGVFGPGGLLEGVVPPIVVLVVEDNMINQKILETFMRKRKIRCLTAKNGREAVDKWKKGGIHLVLMDIQMPIMSGIEATKEIRRLERINNIGVFSKKDAIAKATDEADLLPDLQLRSPVIIVALTASSLQSDRHEALAAGCNDFLTKPVSLVWLERKVFEWGCMQALIDFEGWKKFRSENPHDPQKVTVR